MKTTQPSRRDALGALGAAGAVLALGCSDTPTSPTTTPPTTTTTPTTGTNAACAVTPSETIGPFPSVTDLIRTDIREGKSGVPLTLTVKVVNTNNGCSPVASANVEIWQCDAAGNYSQYGSQAGQTYLRGLQTTNNDGEATFMTIYPGWYQGRATHIHLDVSAGSARKVTQIAFDESVNAIVHATAAYAAKGSNPTSNLADGIFADSLASELVAPIGDPANGYSVTFQVGIAL